MTTLDPTPPGGRYQPRAETYVTHGPLRPQPEHPPEVLARAVCVPPGAASAIGTKPPSFVATFDQLGNKLEEGRRERRKLRDAAKRAEAERRAKLRAQTIRPREPRPPRAGCCRALVLKVLARCRHPLTLAEMRARLPDQSPTAVQSALMAGRALGTLKLRLISDGTQAGRRGEYWPEARAWPDITRYRSGYWIEEKKHGNPD